MCHSCWSASVDYTTILRLVLRHDNVAPSCREKSRAAAAAARECGSALPASIYPFKSFINILNTCNCADSVERPATSTCAKPIGISILFSCCCLLALNKMLFFLLLYSYHPPTPPRPPLAYLHLPLEYSVVCIYLQHFPEAYRSFPVSFYRAYANQ